MDFTIFKCFEYKNVKKFTRVMFNDSVFIAFKIEVKFYFEKSGMWK